MSLIQLSEVTRTVQIPDAEPLTILDGVTLAIEPGERLSIVGRSGSGKSTLLNLLGLLDLPSEGEMLFDGESVTTMSSGRRDRVRGGAVGFIFQQFNLLDGRTALENVSMPLLYAKGPRFWGRARIAAEMLDRVGLSHRLGAMPGSLSGGEQQRVAIARALVRQPRLILADEPTGALDVETGMSVIDLLDEVVAQEGAALVTITHDPTIALLSDSRYRLDHGRLREADADDVADLDPLAQSETILRGAGASGDASSAAPNPVIDRTGEALDSELAAMLGRTSEQATEADAESADHDAEAPEHDEEARS